jgi:phospholipid-binding lipoprotein MlaA
MANGGCNALRVRSLLWTLLVLALAGSAPAGAATDAEVRPEVAPSQAIAPEAAGEEPPEEAAAATGEAGEPDATPLEDLLLEEQLLEEASAAPVPDPLEPWNRGVLGFNRFLDKILFDPITRGYGFVMPDPGKRAVRRFFDNLASPPVLVNHLLQLEGKRAAVTGARFLVNTTVGIAGLFDPAHSLGLERHPADFGHTLWVYGVGSGPYLVLPIFGPSSARDGFGRLVDGALRVDLWLLGGAQIVLLGAGDGFSLREMHLEALDELEKSAIDYYAALRSVYWMNRQHVLEARSADEAEEAAGDGLVSDGGSR